MPETHMHDTRYMAWHAFMCTKTSNWFPPPISLHLSVHAAADAAAAAGDVISSDFFFYFSIKLLFLLFNAFQNPSFSIQTQILLTFHPTQSSFNTPHTLSVSFSLSLSLSLTDTNTWSSICCLYITVISLPFNVTRWLNYLFNIWP